MKKIIGLLALLTLLCVCTCATADNMLVHISAVNYDTNSVGTKWQGAFAIGDLPVRDGDVVDLYVGKYDLTSEIVDYDSTPDVGSTVTSVNVTASRLDKGFTATQSVIVTENSGTRKGYWTEWLVEFEFIPVEGAYVLPMY